MFYSDTEKQFAIKLRSEGKTYLEIQKKLKRNIPKSTLSFWFKKILLPKSYYIRLKANNNKSLKKARTKALITNYNKNEYRLKLLKNKNLYLLKIVNQNIYKIILSILYLTEGAKYKSSRFLSFCSSDSKLIKLYLFLLFKCFSLDNSKFRVRIQCRYDQSRNDVENFWAKITNINKKQFYPTYFDKRTKGKQTIKTNYKGVCTVIYFDTNIQLELELLADSIIEHLTGAVSSVG